MTDQSDRLLLPYLMPAQAQKHVTHNEALADLDVLVQLRLRSLDAVTPPTVPEAGETHALGSGASGVWAGEDGRLASYINDVWQFRDPQEGWQAVGETDGRLHVYLNGAWTDALSATENLPGLGIGTTSDTTNRLAIAAPASLFSHEGAGHQIKVNKAGETDTASLLFQSNWSGRAEMGLAGNDDFSIKVSDDGSTWHDAATVASGTGHVTVPQITSGRITIDDDMVAQVPTPSAGGFVLLSIVDDDYPQSKHSGLLSYDTGPSLFLVALALGPDMSNQGAVALTGTSGSSGKSSVAVTSGALLIENRYGSTRTYSYTFLGGM